MELNWNESYSLGVPIIDSQHKKLFSLIDELSHAMLRGSARYIMQGMLSNLSDYTSYHFSSEEYLMKQYEYPDIEVHRKKHEAFKRDLAGLILRHQEGEAMVSVDMYATLRDWILKHVTEHAEDADQHLADYIKQHPAGVDAFDLPKGNEPLFFSRNS
jgi:hemerythrin-like metal-binding protein